MAIRDRVINIGIKSSTPPAPVLRACKLLNSLLNQVRAQTRKGLTLDQATELTVRGIRSMGFHPREARKT
jgi:hypothetical protein